MKSSCFNCRRILKDMINDRPDKSVSQSFVTHESVSNPPSFISQTRNDRESSHLSQRYREGSRLSRYSGKESRVSRKDHDGKTCKGCNLM